MSYNRWMPVQCSSELYHHGVKGMKWGKHLFGKATELLSGGGGGAAEEDPELADLIEKFKKGLISREAFLKARDALSAKNLKNKIGLSTREELKYQENYRKAFDAAHYNSRDGVWAKMANKERKESNAKINELREKYSKTPLGKAENAISKGVDKVKQALRKREQEKNADTRQFAAHDRETRKRDREERDKLVEEIKEANWNREKTADKATVKDYYEGAKHGKYSSSIADAARKAAKSGDPKAMEQANKLKQKIDNEYKKVDDYRNDSYTSLVSNKKGIRSNSQTTQPTYNRPRSRKRNITGQGTGVHLTGKVNSSERSLITRPRSRKRNVTGKGTGVHLYGSVSSYGRKK